MASMSYCRFENTALDLQACLNDLGEALAEGKTLQEFIDSRSSKYESRAVIELIDLCQEVADLYGEFEFSNDE